MRCHFCGKELPESGGTILYAKGLLHVAAPDTSPYPVCVACLKYHKLKLCKLERTENGK